MFLPLFIALLLGLASPSQPTCGNENTTVQVNSNDPQSDPSTPQEPIGNDDGGGHNGDNGPIRPPKP
jgi:hypothetical protein